MSSISLNERWSAPVWRLLTLADKALIGIALCGAFGLAVVQHLQVEAGAQVRVEVDGAFVGVFDFEMPRQLRVSGPLGVSEVEIALTGARIVSAPCPHKICMRRGWVRQGGEALVCVPNRLVVAIVGGVERSRLDAVTR